MLLMPWFLLGVVKHCCIHSHVTIGSPETSSCSYFDVKHLTNFCLKQLAVDRH